MKKFRECARLCVALLVACVGGVVCESARAQTWCDEMWGGSFISPDWVVVLRDKLVEPYPLMATPNERDGYFRPGYGCGPVTQKTVYASGPYFWNNGRAYDYSSTYYDRNYEVPIPDRNGACTGQVYRWTDRYSNVDANGFNHPSGGGDGTICTTVLRGPEIQIEPLTVPAGKAGHLRVRLKTGERPLPGRRLIVYFDPAPDQGWIGWCSQVTDEKGEVLCDYHAPKRPMVERVSAKCTNSYECEVSGTGTITVTKEVVLGFFNGVWNTEDQAKDGLGALRGLIGPTFDGTPIRYENFYNQTGKGTSSTLLQDIAETFAQRGAELDGVVNNRWEHYWDLISGRHGDPDSLTGSLLRGLGNGGLALARLLDATFNATMGQIIGGWARMLSDPPTKADMAAQLAKLRALADEDAEFVLVAHSQGNLFVNTAYDGLRVSHPQAKAAVVHVAPASPTLRGEHGLSGFDMVINGLRIQGITSVAPANWNIPFSMVDASGHTLVATYLDAAREGRAKVKALIVSALAGL